MTDHLLIERARNIYGRLLAVWPNFPEVLRKYQRIARLLDLPPLDDGPLTHADLDQVEETVRHIEAGAARRSRPPISTTSRRACARRPANCR